MKPEPGTFDSCTTHRDVAEQEGTSFGARRSLVQLQPSRPTHGAPASCRRSAGVTPASPSRGRYSSGKRAGRDPVKAGSIPVRPPNSPHRLTDRAPVREAGQLQVRFLLGRLRHPAEETIHAKVCRFDSCHLHLWGCRPTVGHSILNRAKSSVSSLGCHYLPMAERTRHQFPKLAKLQVRLLLGRPRVRQTRPYTQSRNAGSNPAIPACGDVA